jgi:oligopeptide/dipeptide ABC transporter ATP-binding protein
MSDEVLIEARGLKKHFPIRGGVFSRQIASVKAVDGLDLCVRKGETVGLVGESGCGKTTAGRTMLHLTRPTAGNVYWKMPSEVRERLLSLEEKARVDGSGARNKSSGDIRAQIEEINVRYSLGYKDRGELRRMRKNMQIVFQDLYSSLNPRMLVRDIVGEPLLVNGAVRRNQLTEKVQALLEIVGLNPEHLYRYPHEFSGGQRQRIGIARALALNPELVVLDEPTSALDVSVQAQILNMLNDLQDAYGLTYLFISHDLSTIHYMCDRINVMYLGKIVESARKKDLYDRPLHPYTQALLSAIPVPDPDLKKERVPLAGEIPSPANPPSGCRFHTRCKNRQAICETDAPILIDTGEEHYVACHFWEQI